MLERLGDRFARLSQRFLPDPVVIAVMLTIVVGLLAVAYPGTAGQADAGLMQRSSRTLSMWLTGVWDARFLVFAFQMCVVLLTGFALARSPLATRALHALATLVHSNRQAVVLVALVSCVGCWVNWGFGLIAAGVLAMRLRVELVSRGIQCQHALIVAGAYVGMMIWHGGMSGSAPLTVAGEGVLIRQVDGVESRLPAIPITETTLGSANLILSVALILGIPIVLASMAARVVEDDDLDDVEIPAGPNFSAVKLQSLSERLNAARWLPKLLGAAVLAAVILKLNVGNVSEMDLGQIRWRQISWREINLDVVNSVFLGLGLLMHRSLLSYAHAVAEGGESASGIILQFPLYSGIQGLMAGSGIATGLSAGFVEASAWCVEHLGLDPNHTLPVATFFSAGIVNLFVPSGGGQWIVQGPIMCGTADALGVPVRKIVMALSYGDQWTNMIQPFWAIPLMGLTGVNARKFIGYCALIMLLATIPFLITLIVM